MIEVVPSILAESWHDFVESARKLEPYTERVHFDILDGSSTPGKTILGYDELGKLDTKLKFDVHLMVAHPEQYVPQWLKTGKVSSIILSAEGEGDLRGLIEQIKGQGVKAAISLNPETTIDSTLDYLSMIDYIQFMTVHPGSYGRPFLPEVIDKILTFHDSYPDTPIAVDGGMNPETAKRVVGLGVTILVSGSYVLKSPDIGKAIKELKGEI